MFSALIENFLFNNASMALRPRKGITMIGGGMTSGGQGGFWEMFIIVLLIFLIKVFIVMISYNIVVPKLMQSWGNDMKYYRPISFMETVFLVFLFNNLFSRC